MKEIHTLAGATLLVHEPRGSIDFCDHRGLLRLQFDGGATCEGCGHRLTDAQLAAFAHERLQAFDQQGESHESPSTAPPTR